MNEPDWLDISGIPRNVVEANPKFQALVEAFEKLEPEQQAFVQALPAAHYVAAQAMRNLQAKGVQISERTVYRYMSSPAVKRAIDAHRDLAGDFAGIDALSVMLRVSAWADYCFEEVDLFSRDGKPLGRGKRDAVNGLKALELLGKHTKAIGPDSSTTNITNNAPAQFVYQIISSKEGISPKQIAGSGAVIDAEVTEVSKDE
jgi:hypothetical protein